MERCVSVVLPGVRLPMDVRYKTKEIERLMLIEGRNSATNHTA